MTTTQPAMAAAVASLQRGPSLVRQASVEEEGAAAKIQALARGQLVRKQVKDQRLWDAWNTLDQKEEAELMASHQQYENLKADLKRKISLESKPGSPEVRPSTVAAAAAVVAAAEARKAAQADVVAPVTPAAREPTPAVRDTQTPSPLPGGAATSVSPTVEAVVPAAANSVPPLSPTAVAPTAAPAAPVTPTAATAPTSASPSPGGKTFLIRTKTIPRKPVADAAVKPAEDDGLTLTDPIQLDFVTAMMDHFKFNKLLDLANVVELLRRVKGVLQAQPNVQYVNVATRLTIVGDLHGQLDDLLAIFKLNGLPSPRNAYIFNGDFVDRGQYSCECVLTLFAFKLLYPKSMILNRGNHEARDINSRDGFEKECLHKYNHAIFDLFSDVVHGGLASTDFTIDDLQKVNRFHEIPPGESLQEDVMWSDPDSKRMGRHPSPRGAGLCFGSDVTHAWLHANNMRLIVRSHECQQRGFEMHHGDTMITVFSASNYCGTVNNEGSFIILERDLVPRIVPFFAKPKERLSRYRMRHAILENDIIAKLLQRIADHRLALTDYYSRLNIPFSEFQDYLGLPKLGVDGKKKGDIDYMAFLLRFRPVNAMLAPGMGLSGTGSPNPAENGGRRLSRTALQHVEAILEMLSAHKYELESLFRHFDLNGDESISLREFKEGIMSLQAIMGYEFSPEDVDALVARIDTDHDGHISYAEFFSGFRLADESLGEVQRKQAELAATRNKSGSGLPPSHTPSPTISPRTLQEHAKLREE